MLTRFEERKQERTLKKQNTAIIPVASQTGNKKDKYSVHCIALLLIKHRGAGEDMIAQRKPALRFQNAILLTWNYWSFVQ